MADTRFVSPLQVSQEQFEKKLRKILRNENLLIEAIKSSNFVVDSMHFNRPQQVDLITFRQLFDDQGVFKSNKYLIGQSYTNADQSPEMILLTAAFNAASVNLMLNEDERAAFYEYVTQQSEFMELARNAKNNNYVANYKKVAVLDIGSLVGKEIDPVTQQSVERLNRAAFQMLRDNEVDAIVFNTDMSARTLQAESTSEFHRLKLKKIAEEEGFPVLGFAIPGESADLKKPIGYVFDTYVAPLYGENGEKLKENTDRRKTINQNYPSLARMIDNTEKVVEALNKNDINMVNDRVESLVKLRDAIDKNFASALSHFLAFNVTSNKTPNDPESTKTIESELSKINKEDLLFMLDFQIVEARLHYFNTLEKINFAGHPHTKYSVDTALAKKLPGVRELIRLEDQPEALAAAEDFQENINKNRSAENKIDVKIIRVDPDHFQNSKQTDAYKNYQQLMATSYKKGSSPYATLKTRIQQVIEDYEKLRPPKYGKGSSLFIKMGGAKGAKLMKQTHQMHADNFRKRMNELDKDNTKNDTDKFIELAGHMQGFLNDQAKKNPDYAKHLNENPDAHHFTRLMMLAAQATYNENPVLKHPTKEVDTVMNVTTVISKHDKTNVYLYKELDLIPKHKKDAFNESVQSIVALSTMKKEDVYQLYTNIKYKKFNPLSEEFIKQNCKEASKIDANNLKEILAGTYTKGGSSNTNTLRVKEFVDNLKELGKISGVDLKVNENVELTRRATYR